MGKDIKHELGDFLRGRRARLRPEDTGLPPAVGMRRVPGLRREEVARLAGVSMDYYTRLEQGRHPHVSDGVLSALARVLGLNPLEREYLYGLVRRRDRTGSGHRPLVLPPPAVRPELQQMLDVLDATSPALVINHRYDVLATNPLARVLFTDFEALPFRERNLARFVLLAPAARRLFVDWHEVARSVVGDLRLAAGTHPDDRLLNELVGELCVKVTDFSSWWDDHEVDQRPHGAQHFHHPVAGALTLHHETLTLPADEDQAICLYTADRGSSSAEALSLLAGWNATSDTNTERTIDDACQHL